MRVDQLQTKLLSCRLPLCLALCLFASLPLLASADEAPPRELWVLAGQSNMVGFGELQAALPADDRVSVFDQSGRWVLARDPLHGAGTGVGPGLSFGIEWANRTGATVGLIPCAVGGTSMAQWDPARMGPRSLYAAMLKRIWAATGSRPARIRGVLWYQGEAEGMDATIAPLYEKRFMRLIRAIRKDTGRPGLPFVFAQIGRSLFKIPPGSWNLVREAQRRVAERVAGVTMVATLDLSLIDRIHLDGASQNRLGKRLARAAWRGRTPGVSSASYDPATGEVKVSFRGARGGLASLASSGCFLIRRADGADGADAAPIAALPPANNPNVLILKPSAPPPPGASLWYGFGMDPDQACLLRDSDDLALPAFGPLPLSAQ